MYFSRKKLFAFILILMVGLLLSGCDIHFGHPYVPGSDEDEEFVSDKIPSLYQCYEDYFSLGAAVNSNSKDYELLTKHFNSLTAENEMKPDHLQEEENIFTYNRADEIIEIARDNNMEVRGHVLVWRKQTPGWFFCDDEKIINRMEEHIKNVMGHFGVEIKSWDVVNETVNDDKSSEIYREYDDDDDEHGDRWYNHVRADYVRLAFEFADKYNQHGAKLFYNDYNAVKPQKRDKIIRMLKDLINNGVPIDGIGSQGHWQTDWPSIDMIEEAIQDYQELGLEIQITELDIKIRPGDSEEDQARRYREIFELFMEYSNVIEKVTFWGIIDSESWRAEYKPLLFDENHQ